MTLSIFSPVRFLTGRSQNFYSHAGLKRVRQRSDECVVYRPTLMWSTFIRGVHLPAPVHQPAPVCSRSFVIWLMCVCSRLPLKIADLSCHSTPPTSALAIARHRRVHILQVKDALCKSRASPSLPLTFVLLGPLRSEHRARYLPHPLMMVVLALLFLPTPPAPLHFRPLVLAHLC
jgi:hypothetical protein